MDTKSHQNVFFLRLLISSHMCVCVCVCVCVCFGSGVCFGSFHQLFVLNSTYEMLLAFEVLQLLQCNAKGISIHLWKY